MNQVEKFIIHNANRVAVCRKWPLLPSETQRRIKDAALVVVEFSRPVTQRNRLYSVPGRVSYFQNYISLISFFYLVLKRELTLKQARMTMHDKTEWREFVNRM